MCRLLGLDTNSSPCHADPPPGGLHYRYVAVTKGQGDDGYGDAATSAAKGKGLGVHGEGWGKAPMAGRQDDDGATSAAGRRDPTARSLERGV